MPNRKLTEAEVRAFLLDYAWLDDTPGQKAAEVDCILAQDGWQFIDVMSEQFANAQWKPGPAAVDEGVGFALSALYECHNGPHIASCPRN
jgi:hypothetical protein